MNFKKTRFKGFSLAEVMVTAGIVAVLAVGLMKIIDMQTKAQKKAESDLELTQIVNEMHQVLLNGDACKNTMNPISSVISPAAVGSIINRANHQIYITGNVYRGIKILSIATTTPALSAWPITTGSYAYGELNLLLKFERMSTNGYGAKIVSKSIPIKVEVDSLGKVSKCYSATENAVDTSKIQACQDIGGIFNSSTDLCDLPNYPASIDQNHSVSTKYLEDWKSDFISSGPYVLKAGDTMTGNLGIGSKIRLLTTGQISAQGSIVTTSSVAAANSITSGTNVCVGTRCRDFSLQSCSVGQVVIKINEDGTVICGSVTCPANRFYTGMDSSGSAICKPFPTQTCSANTYVSNVSADGSVTCTPLPVNTAVGPCLSTQKLIGITSLGTAICSIDIDTDTTVQKIDCGTGKYLRGFTSSGSAICVSLPTTTSVNCSTVVPSSQPPCTPSTPAPTSTSSCVYYTYTNGSCTSSATSGSSCAYIKTTNIISVSMSKTYTSTTTSSSSSTSVSATCP